LRFVSCWGYVFRGARGFVGEGQGVHVTTAAELITDALHLFGIVDQTEDPTPTDIANNVKVLNQLLRAEQADGAAQYLMQTEAFTLPAGVNGQPYSFSIGTANASYAIQRDAVAVKSIWMNDLNLTVNRETRQAPKTDVVRTTNVGIINKWHQERKADGSLLISAWQPPNRAVPCLIQYGQRMPALTAEDGSDEVTMPPEGIHDITLLLGRRVFSSYGKSPNDIVVVLQDAERVNEAWRQWARGQQWLRFLRA
jgi:hypothetical protein